MFRTGNVDYQGKKSVAINDRLLKNVDCSCFCMLKPIKHSFVLLENIKANCSSTRLFLFFCGILLSIH